MDAGKKPDIDPDENADFSNADEAKAWWELN